MIELIGTEGSSEYRAAVMVREAIVRLWPEVGSSPADEDLVKIAVSVKLSGYKVQDVDIVLAGRFRTPRHFRPRRVVRDSKGDRLSSNLVAVETFFIAIEVKDHPEERVRVSGDQVSVHYLTGARPGWKSATDQNDGQLHSLSNYLKDRRADLFLHRCMLFPGLGSVAAPTAVAGDFDGHQLFSAVAASAPLRVRAGQGVISAGSCELIERALRLPIFQLVVPSALDRKRMDQLAARNGAVAEILDEAGRAMVLLRGHGGTGKTVALLQAAWQAYHVNAKRTLFLTYNHALAADVRRLMALLGVPASPSEGGVSVETVMSFMYRWFARLSVLEADDVGYDSYPALCNETIGLLKEGALTTDDIEKVKEARPNEFDFDQVFVDEGQDWPMGEVELLKAFYGTDHLVVADGIDQLVRGERPNWLAGVPKAGRKVISLGTCLRMKRNLSIFAASVAERADLSWNVEPSNVAAGGRVVVLKRPYIDAQDLHAKLLSGAKAAGNSEIDMLICVPPAGVIEKGDRRISLVSEALRSWGYTTWDGVDASVRSDFPRTLKEHRIVQYASCRGLEGWTVVLDGLDQFLLLKEAEKLSLGLSPSEQDGFSELPILARKSAFRWGLIALTRPIDTLVITLWDPNSRFGQDILRIAEQLPDLVEVL